MTVQSSIRGFARNNFTDIFYHLKRWNRSYSWRKTVKEIFTTRAEAMDIVDEKPDLYALKQLISLVSYLEESAKVPTNDKHWTKQRRNRNNYENKCRTLN